MDRTKNMKTNRAGRLARTLRGLAGALLVTIGLLMLGIIAGCTMTEQEMQSYLAGETDELSPLLIPGVAQQLQESRKQLHDTTSGMGDFMATHMETFVGPSEVEYALVRGDAEDAARRIEAVLSACRASAKSSLGAAMGEDAYAALQGRMLILRAALPLFAGKPREAIGSLRQASTSASPRDQARAQLYTATCYARLGYAETASRMFADAVGRKTLTPYDLSCWELYTGGPGAFGALSPKDLPALSKLSGSDQALRFARALVCRALATLYLQEGNSSECRNAGKEARKAAKGVSIISKAGGVTQAQGFPPIGTQTHMTEIQAYLEAGNTSAAVKASTRALEGLGYENCKPELATEAHALACWAYGADGKQKQAERFAAYVEKHLGETKDLVSQWKPYMYLGRGYAAIGRDADAERCLKRSVEIVEGIRTDALSMAARATFMAQRDEPFRELCAFLVAKGDGTQGFHVAERWRSRALNEALAAAGTQTAVSRRYIELERKASGIRRALTYGSLNEQAQKKLHEELTQIEGDLVQAREAERVERSSTTHRPLTLAEFQSLLGADQTALVYVPLRKQGAAWAISKDASHLASLPGEAALARSIQKLRQGLTGDLSDAWRGPSASLYDQLVAPLAKEVPLKKRVVVVPGGVLASVPFEALWDRSSNKLLLDDHVVSYAPSGTSLSLLAKRGRVPMSQVLVVSQAKYTDRARQGEEMAMTRGTGLGDLPFADREGETVAGIYGTSGAKWLRNERATESAVKGVNLGSYSVIHFASHGLIPSDLGWLSKPALMLGTSGANDPEDGLLMADEIERLPLRCDLTVLSACNTAQGRMIRGEGPMGLSRSFLAAGTRRVLVSLWSVSDLSTAKLMARFHESIKAGRPADEALYEAKQWLIKQTFTPAELRGFGGVAKAVQKEAEGASISVSHPFFWAPFVLVGAGE